MIDRRKNTEFGIILSLALIIISVYCHIQLEGPVIITLLVTLLAPKLYMPFTWLWFRLGDLMGIVATRCILFLLFFLIVTPVGIIRRWMNKETLHLKQFRKGSGSVFIAQEKTYSPQDLDKQY